MYRCLFLKYLDLKKHSYRTPITTKGSNLQKSFFSIISTICRSVINSLQDVITCFRWAKIVIFYIFNIKWIIKILYIIFVFYSKSLYLHIRTCNILNTFVSFEFVHRFVNFHKKLTTLTHFLNKKYIKCKARILIFRVILINYMYNHLCFWTL